MIMTDEVLQKMCYKKSALAIGHSASVLQMKYWKILQNFESIYCLLTHWLLGNLNEISYQKISKLFYW